MIPVFGVPVLNRPDLMNALLESLDYPIKDLIIVDNSGSMSFEKPDCVESMWHLKMPSNLGVASSWNLIIKSTPMAPWWLICNSDIEFLPGQLEKMASQSSSNILGVVKTDPGWCCFSIGDQIVSTVGLFDELFYPAYFEDTDYENRMKIFNKNIQILDIEPLHQNSSTIESDESMKEQMHPIFQQNRNVFLNKKQTRNVRIDWSLSNRRLKNIS